jgi:tRNA(Ile)-lysidine synthase
LSNGHPFEVRFEAEWPARSWCDLHVVLAVSAGPDSVAMLRAALRLKNAAGGSGQLTVAHLNHGLRRSDADADEAWLRTLCQRLDVPLEVGKANVAELAAEQGDGLEAAARTARYDFLRHTAEHHGARFVATAHTVDDQVETILHRIVRGTGLSGLAGIPKTRPLSPSVTLVRPILGARRAEVLEYLAALGQDFRIDTTNADPRFTRNRLRSELLPKLREHYNPEVDAALLRLAAQADESHRLISDFAANLAPQCVTLVPTSQIQRGELGVGTQDPRRAASQPAHESQSIRIQCGPLASQPALLIREVCKIAWTGANWPRQAMTFHHWQQLANLVLGKADSPAINLPGNIHARREGSVLVLERLDHA